MKRLEEYNAAGLASIGREAFWHAVAEACPDIKSGDMAPGEDLAFERESVSVVETWLRNNVPDEPKRWTLVVEAPREPARLDESVVTVTRQDTLGSVELLRVVEVHHEDMLERGV